MMFAEPGKKLKIKYCVPYEFGAVQINSEKLQDDIKVSYQVISKK